MFDSEQSAQNNQEFYQGRPIADYFNNLIQVMKLTEDDIVYNPNETESAEKGDGIDGWDDDWDPPIEGGTDYDIGNEWRRKRRRSIDFSDEVIDEAIQLDSIGNSFVKNGSTGDRMDDPIDNKSQSIQAWKENTCTLSIRIDPFLWRHLAETVISS